MTVNTSLVLWPRRQFLFCILHLTFCQASLSVNVVCVFFVLSRVTFSPVSQYSTSSPVSQYFQQSHSPFLSFTIKVTLDMIAWINCLVVVTWEYMIHNYSITHHKVHAHPHLCTRWLAHIHTYTDLHTTHMHTFTQADLDLHAQTTEVLYRQYNLALWIDRYMWTV